MEEEELGFSCRSDFHRGFEGRAVSKAEGLCAKGESSTDKMEPPVRSIG